MEQGIYGSQVQSLYLAIIYTVKEKNKETLNHQLLANCY